MSNQNRPFLSNDVCRCRNQGCELRTNCLRFLAPVGAGERCPIAIFEPVDGQCEHLIKWRKDDG
jgi:hypothetical protein